jgi:hypothetical protein
MGEHTASPIRNSLLVLCLIVAVVLAVGKIPDYLAMF